MNNVLIGTGIPYLNCKSLHDYIGAMGERADGWTPPLAKSIGNLSDLSRLCRNQASLASRRVSGYRNASKKSGRQQP